DAALDYTLVKVENNPSAQFGSLNLRERSVPAKNDCVVIIQHPKGGLKQIALTDNRVHAVWGDKLQYFTDTEPGSSGSPVFDVNWRLVGLHHAGGNLPGPGGVEFVNEAILIEKVVRHAAAALGMADEVYELVTGPVLPILTWVAVSAGKKDDLVTAGRIILQHGSDLVSALKNRVRPEQEVGPLAAAMIGVAAGAVIRHVGRKNESLANAAASPADLGIGETADALKADVASAQGEPDPESLYSAVLARAANAPEAYKPLLDRARTIEALPVVVGAFLAGVVVGSKAYDGKL
ncbi:MAG: serine protease, partial [Pseudomonadota bacterium]